MEPNEQRVDELISQMTLREKISLLSGLDTWNTVPVPRLGLPSLTMTDGPHGIRTLPEGERKTGPATSFSTGNGIAATWNTDLVRRVGEALAEESLYYGCHILLGPTVNIVRHPLAGRNFETYSEDPFLAGRIGTAWIQGLQSRGVGASLKHFAANNQEVERDRGNSVIDERTLREIYLSQFETIVKEAQPWTVMCSYNRLNGVYASQNHKLLTEILRDEWGFEGVVVSDWGANHTIFESVEAGLDIEMPGPAKYYGNLLLEAALRWQIEEEAITRAARRVVRMVVRSGKMDGPAPEGAANTPEHQALARQVAEESITLLKNEPALLPLKVDQIRSLAVIGPHADNLQVSGGGSAFVHPPYEVSPLQGLKNLLGDRVTIHYEQGVDSYATLPLLKAAYMSAEDGSEGWKTEYYPNPEFSGPPSQVRTRTLINNFWFSEGPINSKFYSVRWSGEFTAPSTGLHTFQFEHSATARLYLDDQLILDSTDHIVTVWRPIYPKAEVELEAGKTYRLRCEFVKDNDDPVATVRLFFGFTPLEGTDDRFERAVAAARDSDVALVFLGLPEGFETEGADRPDLELTNRQNELVEAVARVNPNTVVVLNSAAPVRMPWLGQVPAALLMYYPGQEGGTAIARILTGEVNPSGKLTVTFPHRLEDTPAFNNYPGGREVVYGESIFVGYRHYDLRDIQPLLPFGHGLSYTTFGYGEIQSPEQFRLDQPLEVSLPITNTGQQAGQEVVQLYIHDRQSSLPRPPKELKGFSKVSLAPGETQTVTFHLDRRAFSYYDPTQKQWVAEPGEFELIAGSSSRDLRASKVVTLVE